MVVMSSAGLDKVRRSEGAELDACDWLRCFCLWRLCDSPSIFSEEIPFLDKEIFAIGPWVRVLYMNRGFDIFLSVRQ